MACRPVGFFCSFCFKFSLSAFRPGAQLFLGPSAWAITQNKTFQMAARPVSLFLLLKCSLSTFRPGAHRLLGPSTWPITQHKAF